MIRRLFISATVSLFLVAPVLADTTIAPSTNTGSDATAGSTLQPNGSSDLQGAQGINSNNVSALTGGVALQPAGDQSNVSALLLGGVEGSPQSSSDTSADRSTTLAMAIAAFGFVVAALLIFRTSRRLEAVNEVADEAGVASAPAKRKPKKAPKKPKAKPKSRKS